MITPVSIVPNSQTTKQIATRSRHTRYLESRVSQLERYLFIQHTITQIIATSTELTVALPQILKVICEATHWDFGEVWYVNPHDNRLYCEATWHLPTLQFPKFERSGQNVTFTPGQGLPGRAWKSGKPAWIPNVIIDSNFLRAKIAEQDGLHAGIAIPIRAQGAVIGTLTFFSRQTRSMDRELMQMLDTAGNQIGLFIERKRAEQVEREKISLTAALQERQRLARDLHDSVTQTLFSASVMAEMLPVVWSRDPAQVKPGLEEIQQLTRNALSEMRSMLCELRASPSTAVNLADLLKELTDKLARQTNIQIVLETQLTTNPPADVQIALYRITQEALNNIVKHAAATQVRVLLEGSSHQLTLQIEDNGRGFDPGTIPAEHFGVAIMRERAEAVGAVLQIDSNPGEGTCLTLHTPLAASVA